MTDSDEYCLVYIDVVREPLLVCSKAFMLSASISEQSRVEISPMFSFEVFFHPQS